MHAHRRRGCLSCRRPGESVGALRFRGSGISTFYWLLLTQSEDLAIEESPSTLPRSSISITRRRA